VRFLRWLSTPYYGALLAPLLLLARQLVLWLLAGVWSATADLARGDKGVARLKRERDIAEGVVEAAKQAGWRASKDRDDVQAFIGWSQRREFAEAGVGA
jgi:hypothetical protein